jgi:hypothetical protein
MLLFLLPIPDAVHRSSPWALALTIAVLTVPLVIVILALAPALMVSPLLPERHQRLALRLLASLREWATSIPDAVWRDAS